MAKQTFISGNVTDADVEPIEDMTNDEFAAFSAFQESFSGEQMGTLRVQRVPTEQMRAGASKGAIKGVFLFSCAVDQYTFDELMTYLRDTYGTGTYRIIGVRTGNRGIAFNRIVDVEKPEGVSSAAPSAPQSGTASDLSSMMANFATVVSGQLARVVDVVQKNAPQIDPFEQMERMARIMSVMKSDAPRVDVLSELERVQKIAEVIGIGRSGGETTNADVFLGLVKEFGPALSKAAISMAPAQAPIPPMRPALETATPAQPTQEKSVDDPKTIYLRQQAKQLLMFANAGMSAKLLAGNIIDNVPDDQLSALEEFARDPDATAKLIAALPPGSEKHSQWFADLRASLIEEFEALREPDAGGDEMQQYGTPGEEH